MFQLAPRLQLLFITQLHPHRLMASSPSAAQPSSSMEGSQQPDQPISTQHGGAADRTAVTSQPVSAEQQAPPDGTRPTEESKDMDHLTVISENMETSKYTCPLPVHEPPGTPSNTVFTVSLHYLCSPSNSNLQGRFCCLM